MPTFKDLNSLFKHIETKIQDTMTDEVADTVKENMAETIQANVYNAYMPQYYNRKAFSAKYKLWRRQQRIKLWFRM